MSKKADKMWVIEHTVTRAVTMVTAGGDAKRRLLADEGYKIVSEINPPRLAWLAGHGL